MLTLGDLASQGRWLIVRCNTCGHLTLIDLGGSPDLQPFKPDEVRGRFNCQCGRKDVLVRGETEREVRKGSLR
jgi:ribosomal protein S27E